MNIDANNLPDDINALKNLLLKSMDYSSKIIAKKDQKISELEEKLQLQLAARFGAKSERFIDPNQPSLFNETEEVSVSDKEESTEEVNDEIKVEGFTRKKGKRKPIPDNLKREVEYIDLEESEKICAAGGKELVKFGEEISEKLEIIPQRVFVKQIVRAKYKCSCCSEDKKTLVTAGLPKQIIPKSMASPSLLSYISVSKYVDHLPLHRLEKMFERINVEIPRSTMSRWMIKASDALVPLYNLMEEKLLAREAIQMDETTVQVLKEKNKTATSKSYMWVRASVPGSGPPIVLYDYHPTRSSGVIDKLLAGYKGILQTDGYGGYDSYCAANLNVDHAGCFAHARRKFFEAVKVSKKKNNPIAKKGFSYFKEIYKIDKKANTLSSEDRLKYRQENLLPLLNEMKEWLDEVLPKTPASLKTGTALTYLNNQFPKLLNTASSGDLPLDTNFVENKIRPFTLGRKNWMFSDTAAGAGASAMLYSILETAKANGKEPYSYMQMLFEKIPHCTSADDFEILLPF